MKKEQTKYSRLSSCKKIISAILSVTALLTMSVTTASATLTDGDFNYEVNEDGTVMITKYIGNDSNVIIPNKIDDKIVTSIFQRAFECDGLKSVTFPSTLETIKSGAFRDCIHLEYLYLPDSVTHIEHNAFYGCNSLEEVHFSNSLEFIGSYAFTYCNNLKTVTFPASIKNIGESAFIGCGALETIVFPNADFTLNEKSFGYQLIGRNDDFKVTEPIGLDEPLIPNFKIYGYAGTDAEKYALENEFDFVAMDESVSELTDNTTGIIMNGEFDYDTELNVVEVTPTQENSIKEYEITLVKNGEVVQPNGEITISIPNETAKCKVFWIKEDGTTEDMNAIYENGYYVFNTNHLSIYSVVEQKENPTEKPSQEPTQDSTDEPTNPTVEPAQPVTEPTDPTDVPNPTNPTDNPTNPTTPTDNPTNKPNSNIITNNTTTGKTAGAVNTGDTSFIFVALMVIGVAGTATFIVRKVKYSK